MKFRILILSISALIILFINSCEDIKKLQIDPQSGKDYVKAESTYSNIFHSVNDAVQASNLEKGIKNVDTIPSCMKITVSTGFYPKTITIVFDSINGCDKEGVIFKGTINATISGPYKTPGTVVNVTFHNLFVNGNKVEGQKTITNMGRNDSNKLVYTVEVKNGIITTLNGQIKYTATKTWTWLKGESTTTISDDVYELEGNADGYNIDNLHFKAKTISPLIIQMNCRWKLVSGKMEIDPDSGENMTIDYGNGTCDDKAILKIGNLADINITL